LLPGYTPYVRSWADLDCMIRTIEEYLHFFKEEIGGVSMTPHEFRRSVAPTPHAAPELEAAGSLAQ